MQDAFLWCPIDAPKINNHTTPSGCITIREGGRHAKQKGKGKHTLTHAGGSILNLSLAALTFWLSSCGIGKSWKGEYAWPVSKRASACQAILPTSLSPPNSQPGG